MKQPFFLASCAVIFAATLRAQTLDPEGAAQSFKTRFETGKAAVEAVFQAAPDGRSWTVTSSEPVDGKPLKISVTTADAFAHVKALGWWGAAGRSRTFAPKDARIDGIRFSVSFEAPRSSRNPSSVTIARGAAA
jgi:hypothetical protein